MTTMCIGLDRQDWKVKVGGRVEGRMVFASILCRFLSFFFMIFDFRMQLVVQSLCCIHSSFHLHSRCQV